MTVHPKSPTDRFSLITLFKSVTVNTPEAETTICQEEKDLNQYCIMIVSKNDWNTYQLSFETFFIDLKQT